MSRWRLYLAFVIALAVVGFISSRERLPDNRFYIQASERMINPGCAEIHCFRVLVPWTIGAIPATGCSSGRHTPFSPTPARRWRSSTCVSSSE
jgi:hypothetical protein